MRLLDWLLGRGSNPLEREQSPVPSKPHVRVPRQDAARQVEEQRARLETSVQAVRGQATALGVSEDTMRLMVEQLHTLVAQVGADPRAWGFDLAAPDAERRDIATEYRRATRLTGTLGESLLVDHGPLLELVPDPPTMPDGTPLDLVLQRSARLEPDAARDVARHVRSTIQVTLGRPLDADAFERAVREAAWDHEFDAARVTPAVLRAVEDVL